MKVYVDSASRYSPDKAIIINDLSKERPLWILSAYGPGKHSPVQLFGGFPREQSFEELRLRHYELASIGNQQQAIQEAQVLVNTAEQQIKAALDDIDGAIRYIVNEEQEHPNRNDICKAKGADLSQLPGAAGNSQQTLKFGEPSAISKTGAFQVAPQATTAFNRPSTSFGQPSLPGSSFGKPSILGQPAPSVPALGQPSTFGKPSPLGQFPTLFSQSSNPSPFGAVQAGSTPLGGVSASATAQQATSAFSQPNPFSQSSKFGQPSMPVATGGLSQNTTAVIPSSSPNAFNTPIAPASTNTVGQHAMANPTPFAQTGITQPSMLFARAPIAPMTSGQLNTPITSSAFGAIAAQASNSQHDTAQRDPQGKLITWKGKSVSYLDDEPCFKGKDNNWEKIWFPDGPPVFKKAEELPEENYDQATKESYKFLETNGAFKDGVMPYLPPRREWCSWDF